MPITSADYRPDPAILRLGDGFYDVVKAARFPAHTLRFRNPRWASRVGLGGLDAAEWERHFAAFDPLPQNLAEPLALRYHGHQFAVYNPALGDGRGFLFAQIREVNVAGEAGAEPPRLLDLGTKGSGRTPWSRGGDGRLTLKGGVREALATEMLEALGVYTSKTFSLFETGEQLMRGDEPSPTRSSVLVRLNHSHIRFGSFQRHAYLDDTPRLAALLAYSVEHYAPHLAASGEADLPVAFVADVSRKAADLCASYMIAGFVHGVLNTDNMNITGESFDYGPYRFLPTYDPAFTAAYFDHTGLYAFGRQPQTFLWNLTRLADALRPLSPNAAFGPALREFEGAFHSALRGRLLKRLGLRPNGPDIDGALVDACFDFLGESQVGFDQFFFDWYGGAASRPRALAGPAAARYSGPRADALLSLFEAYEPATQGALDRPYFQRQTPVTLLIDEIESLWAPIAERDDWSLFEAKIEAIRELHAAVNGEHPAGA